MLVRCFDLLKLGSVCCSVLLKPGKCLSKDILNLSKDKYIFIEKKVGYSTSLEELHFNFCICVPK